MKKVRRKRRRCPVHSVLLNLTDLNSCTSNLAQNSINFQVSNMVVSFTLSSGTFGCFLWQKLTMGDSGTTPSGLVLVYATNDARNTYLMNLNSIQGANLQTGNQTLILSPLVNTQCSCSPTCNGCTPTLSLG